MGRLVAVASVLLGTPIAAVNAGEPPIGTFKECWNLVGTSWEGKVTQGKNEMNVVVTIRDLSEVMLGGHYTFLGVLLEFPDATEEQHKQFRIFFGVHDRLNRIQQKPDFMKSGQYLLAIREASLIHGFPASQLVQDSRGRFQIAQVMHASVY